MEVAVCTISRILYVSHSCYQFERLDGKGCLNFTLYKAAGAFARVQRYIAPPFFKMDCNAPPNFEDHFNNLPKMGV